MSVVFDFSASHNDVAPLSPIWFTGGIERIAFLWMHIVSLLFCLYDSDRAQ